GARINTAHATGGASCLVSTVKKTTGIPVTHYAEVNFVGFLRMVDAVGGVSLYLSEPMVDRYAGVDLPAGCVTLDGRKALGFVRARHVDSDLGRIARQQRFLKELASEIAQPATLLNLPRLFRTAHAGAAALTADEDLGPVELLKLARGARGMAGGGIASYTVPAAGARRGGAAVLLPDEDAAADLFAAFATGRVLEASGALPDPSDVTVAVRNGAGIAGLAGQVAEELRAQGFRVADVGNADTVDRTVIRHAPEDELAARRVAEAVPGAVLEVRAPGTPLVLVLGPMSPSSEPPASAEPGEQPPAPAVGAGEPPPDC
ncbi:MAG TPA: LCP family protein, partial [Egibacteraceae bacterium]|nr:LCP family protein [Egibacteraceae bacterium]